MKAVISILKGVVNVFLYFIYTVISITIVNFIYGFFMRVVFDKAVPGSSDPVHMKIALLVAVVILLLTILGRKFFYFRVFGRESEVENDSLKKKMKESEDLLKERAKDLEKEVDEMKIYIDKEIK